jgi:hypothetical protein
MIGHVETINLLATKSLKAVIIYVGKKPDWFKSNEINVKGDSTALIYTENSRPKKNDLAFIKKHPEHFQFIKGTNATDGNNQSIPVGFYKAKELKIAHVVFKNVDVYGLDLTLLREKLPNVIGIIGMNIIKEHKWTFDLPESRYTF